MIDIASRGIAAAPSSGPASDPLVDSGPAFATLLMRALAWQGEGDRDRAASTPAPAVPPPPMVERPVDATNMPLSNPGPVGDAEQRGQPVVDQPDVESRNRPVIDHAVRFDARGVLNMAATETGAILVARSIGAAFPMGVVAGRAGEPPCPVEASLPARTLVLPGTAVAVVDALAPPAARVAPRTPSSPLPPPVAAEPAISSSLPDAPDDAPVVRFRPRAFTTMARGAPQVAVAALADGLAVVAAVGALSDAERHRLRDAIAATVARHGYHPRTVTLLAMPAPVRFPES